MRLTLVTLWSLALWSCAPVPEPSVLVWPEVRQGGEWVVHFSYAGREHSARCDTVESARVLYAVLAKVMVGGR